MGDVSFAAFLAVILGLFIPVVFLVTLFIERRAGHVDDLPSARLHRRNALRGRVGVRRVESNTSRERSDICQILVSRSSSRLGRFATLLFSTGFFFVKEASCPGPSQNCDVRVMHGSF